MKVLVVSPWAYSFWQFRGELLKEMVELGHDVVAVAPDVDGEKYAAEFGVRYICLPFNRIGIQPLKDIGLIFKLKKIIEEQKPDIVFSYAIKPVIYGSIAARLAGIKKIYSLVPGIGYLFNERGLKASILRAIVSLMYKAAFLGNDKVFFQNSDNRDVFVNRGLLPSEKCVVVNGSGINLERFTPCELPQENVFLMIARVLKDKGVMEYIEAAKIVKRKYPDAVFKFLGPFDSNPAAIKEEVFRAWISDGSVEYLVVTEDVRPYIRDARIFVLPSYHEGTPHTVLEAMAMRRPIITTDVAGCRETVIDGETGLLATVKNAPDLADKMICLIEHPDLCDQMAENSYHYCVRKYNVVSINNMMLSVMNLKNSKTQ